MERVVSERRRRGWSARDAATAGRISNTSWSRAESSGEVSAKMRGAVSVAYGWETDWPENPPVIPPGEAELVGQALERLTSRVEALEAWRVSTRRRPPRQAGPASQ